MTREMFVSSTPHETKVALVEDDQLAEIFFERENEYTLAGSIYKGRVTRVLPGMQSAFVDIGLERDAFLYVSDFLEVPEDEESEFDEIAVTRPEAFVSTRPAPEPRHEFKPETLAPPAEAEEEESEGEEDLAEGNTQEFAEAELPSEDRPYDSAQRFRGGRRRRRGRRGRAFPESKFARPAREEAPESGEDESEPREQYGPPPGYEPIILPGESLSKYRPRESALEPAAGAEAETSEVETSSQSSEEAVREAEPLAEAVPQRRETAEPPSRTPIVLPGESIAKYRPREVRNEPPAAADEADVSTKPLRKERFERAADAGRGVRFQDAAPPVEFRPRGEREPRDFAAPGGSFAVLPGESIAKYRNANSSTPPDSSMPAESVAREQVTRVSQAEPQNAQPEATFVIESDPWSEAAEQDNAEIAATQAPESAPETEDREERLSGEEQKIEQMNVAAVFGGDAAETPQPSTAEARSSEPQESAVSEVQPDTGELDERIQTMIIGGAFGDVFENAVPAAEPPSSFKPAEAADTRRHAHDENDVPARDAQAREGHSRDEHRFGHPGQGMLEHEEIEGEEEEASFRPPAEEEADADYLELEEETLHAEGPERREASDVTEDAEADQLTEAVEDSDIERAAMSDAYETEDEGQYDEDTEFEEEELVDGEEAFPEEQQEEAIGRAEVRAPMPTAGYQRSAERMPYDRRTRGRRPSRGRMPRRREAPRQQLQISDLLKEGQEVLVQIAKEPIGKKGARITSHIALPGRFLVYMPTVNHIGVSRKITSDEERLRLKRIMLSEREGGHGGFIVRTAAAGVGEDELRADIRFLKNLWAQIRQRTESSKPPALIYHDLNLVERILRDQVTSDFSQIWVDTEQEYERILNFSNRFQPSLVRRVKLYTRETPLFEQFGIQEEINKALKAKVWLKSGGYIVINQTEALVAIDINTGKYVGKTARLEDTIVKTNVDAIREIVRQIRLRDLGGIIVIDFIDMDERKNRQKVMQALEEALRADRSPSKVLAFNDFGLVAITRKRVKQSLERTLGCPCSYCSGNGFVKSVTTICNEIFVELRKMARHLEHSDIVNLRVHPEVAKALKADKGKWLADFEELTRRNVLVKPDPLLHQEQFDIH